MTTMKRRTVIAVTAGVWVAAVGSAAALTYDLNRPLHWVDTTLLRTTPVYAVRAAEPAAEMLSVLNIPTITIVGHAPHHLAVPLVPKAPNIVDMKCTDWRDLDMGSGRVQVCE
jgi:hypothetical protein